LLLDRGHVGRRDAAEMWKRLQDPE
jgi:hypothetical protein